MAHVYSQDACPDSTCADWPAPCSFKTLLNPGAADEYASKNRRSSGGGGGGGGGGGYGRQSSRGPRVTGLSDLRDASGGELLAAVAGASTQP